MVPRPSAAIGDNRRLWPRRAIIDFALIAGAAWLSAASLRLSDAADFMLAAYLCATGGLILLVLALFTVPLLFVVALVLVPSRRWLPVGIAGAVSIGAAGLWYVFHAADEDSHLHGTSRDRCHRLGGLRWP